MQFHLPHIIIPITAGLLFSACLQEPENERIPVRYTILVRDRETDKAIQGAKVSLTAEDETERTLKTDKSGRITFPSVESYVNQVIVTKDGYIPTDTVDVVSGADSSYSVMLRTLNLALQPEGSTSADTSETADTTDTGTK